MIVIIYKILIRIILTILIVHYTTGFFDTINCEEISPDGDAFPESEPEPTTMQIIKYMTVGALIVVGIQILVALWR